MKASLKLVTSEKETVNGYPVYVMLVDGKFRSKLCITHCFIEDWDFKNKLPYKHHPGYYEILPTVLDYKAKIKKINFGEYDFKAAKLLLFSDKKEQSMIFFKSGLKLCDGTKTGNLYKTVLNSFQMVFPDVLIDDITPIMARKYMDYLLKINSPNGVHAYMSKLNAIFNKVTDVKNPFSGVRPRKVKTAQRRLVDADVLKLINTRTIIGKYDGKNTNETINEYRYYWLLMFYLGGINFVDLAKMRYDKHVIDGRVQFNRNKGGTNVFINNLIVPQATEILKKFDCYPYLVPIYKAKKLDNFRNNMNRRFIKRTEDLKLTNKPTTYSARYTFINRARQLFIDERICIEIVGHEQQKTHSIYTDEYPLSVRDAAHLKIVALPASV